MNIYHYLSSRSHLFLFTSSCVLTLLLGVIDYLTGTEVSFSIFYLTPVSIVAWFVGKRPAIMISLLAGISWLLADILGVVYYSYPLIPYWNALVRFGFFLIVSFTLSNLSATQQRKEELAQFIFHDLRSPLATTISGLSAIRDLIKSKEHDDLDEYVRMCLISCNRMSLLIQSLLDLARLESGNMQLYQGPVVVKELIDSALVQVSVYAKRNNIQLITELDQQVVEMHADFGLTERILVNLLSNAIKFSKLGTSVRIQVTPSLPNLYTAS
ncbi:MAG: histidine kinase dimerization/phospho-acceptor domain-containing protein [bacterium]